MFFNHRLSASCLLSIFSRGIFLFDNRDSAPALFSETSFALGPPTVLTEEGGIAGDPLFGGTGGLEEECRRWWECDVKEAVIEVGVPGLDGIDGALGQERATRRRDELNIQSAMAASIWEQSESD